MKTITPTKPLNLKSGPYTQWNAGRSRRRRERLEGEVPGWLMDLTEQGSDLWEVRVKDVCRYGVGFESSQALEPGESTKLRIGRGPLELAKPISVVRCEATQHGTYRIGAVFSS